ncbi:MAG: FAD-binding oxidoreductase [Limibacillus sp.]|jgi:glycine/D-amino acid oxidase-like deaminating enzyme
MTRQGDFFSPDFKPHPYWWEASPREAESDAALPDSTDLLVIGAGYTGLHAAIETARRGLKTVVVDAEAAGWGCSSRNGGHVSTSIKPSYAALKKRYGEELAVAILKEGQASLDHVGGFVRQEGIDCDFTVAGRFHGAHNRVQYEKLERACAAGNPVFDTGAWMVPRDRQSAEIGTDLYHGGIVYPRYASLDPGKYHSGLLRLARQAGAALVDHCRVTGLERVKQGFAVQTAKGGIRAGKVILATNGYTGPLTPWQRQRVIPIGSYIIATEEIPKETMDRLFPADRIFTDTRKLVYYYRPSPDRRRILFGGRVSLMETDPKKSGPKLLAELRRLFPELGTTRISHSWTGTVAYTFDSLTHCGEQDGLHYAMGYCGSGVGMAGYLGAKMGRAAAGVEEAPSPFSRIPFPTRPLYSGSPWFLAPSVAYYRFRDRLPL